MPPPSDRTRPTPGAPRHEDHLRDLASLIAECRTLTSKLDALAQGPGPGSAPFLFRQLAQVLAGLERSARTAIWMVDEPAPSAPAPSGGLFGRFKRSKRAAEPRPEEPSAEGLQGNSWTIAIPELIGFLSNTRKTGVLWVHAADETFLLQFSGGTLLHATSDRTPQGERLGELLVARGALSASELREFLAAQPEGKLGSALHREGRVSKDHLSEALSEQIQRLFHRMLGARHSVFRFQEGLELLVQHQVRLNVMQLLLETAKTFDESEHAASRAEPERAPERSTRPLDLLLGAFDEAEQEARASGEAEPDVSSSGSAADDEERGDAERAPDQAGPGAAEAPEAREQEEPEGQRSASREDDEPGEGDEERDAGEARGSGCRARRRA